MQIRVWAPERAELAPWSCKVEITKLFSPAKSIYGEDSWQAQALAMHFAASLVQHFIEQGGILYWPGTEEHSEREEFQITDLAPQLRK